MRQSPWPRTPQVLDALIGDPTRDPILELINGERARAEELLNYVRGAVLLVLTAIAIAYAPRIDAPLRMLNFSVIIPLMLWTVAQHVIAKRNQGSMQWLSILNPIIDVTAVSAILLGYGVLGSPVLAVKTPAFAAYFAILAARPVTSSTRMAAFTTGLATIQYLAIVLYVVSLNELPITTDPVASVSSPALSYLDQGARLLLLLIMGTITTYATAWNERLLRRAMEAQVRRAAEERALSQRLQETDKLSALGTLAASVAHEVCSPLTSIAMLADMMKKSAEHPAIREDATTIAQEARRTEVVIRDLLQVARPRNPESKPVALEDVVTRSLSLLRLLIRDQGIRVETAFEPDIPEIVGDASRLEQVTLNLIINAVHAMENSAREKVIRIELRHDGGGHHVVIEDTGPGISTHVASRIFERFFTTKQVGKGTGLGLWIVRQIIEEHGGTIRAENAASGGARFEIVIPKGARRLESSEYELVAQRA